MIEARSQPGPIPAPAGCWARDVTKTRRNQEMTDRFSQLSSHAPDVPKMLAFMLALLISTSAQVQSNSVPANSGTTTTAAGSAMKLPVATSTAASQKPARCLPRMTAPPRPGQHTVILTWKPSPSSNAVGYCLYRRKTPHIPSKISACSDCEQLNTVPIKGIGCVDDAVPDDVTYYYVATAINQSSDMSEVSNEATPTKKPIPPGSFPSCRQN